MPAAAHKKLLLIEDETDLCSVLSELLCEHQWDVTIAHSIRSSKSLIESEDWTCILLDLHLADGSADELFQSLQRCRQKTVGSPRILLMTGVPGTTEESRLLPLIDNSLAKPFSTSELLAILQPA